MELDYSKKEKIVGIFVICIILVLLSTVIILGRGKNWFQDYNIYYTTFDESYNLNVGADVKLFKTNIGKVKRISVEEKVRVKLAILEKYESRIRTDTLVTVESPTFIGSEYISIIPGSTQAPLLPQEGEIKSKAKKSIADLLAEFEVEKTAKKFIQAIQNISEFTQTLKDPEGPLLSAIENINQATANIENVTKSIESGDGTLGSLLKSTLLMDTILNRLDKVGEIFEHIAEASAKIPATVDRVDGNLDQYRQVGEGILKSIDRLKVIMLKIDANMATVKSILDNVEVGSRDIPQLTDSVSKTIQGARDEIENVDKIIQSLQKNILIRSNLPPEPIGENTDAGLRR